MNKLAEIFATVLYIGRLPLAPGTWCSFIALVVWYILRFWIAGNFILYASLILFFVGVAVSTIHAETLEEDDPSEMSGSANGWRYGCCRTHFCGGWSLSVSLGFLIFSNLALYK